jgi:hypothetical protein
VRDPAAEGEKEKRSMASAARTAQKFDRSTSTLFIRFPILTF